MADGERRTTSQSHSQKRLMHELAPLDERDLGSGPESDQGSNIHVGVKRALDDPEPLEERGKKPRVDDEASRDVVPDKPTTMDPSDMDLTRTSESISMYNVPIVPPSVKHLLAQLEEHKQALTDLQYRHEDQFQDLHRIRQERDSLHSEVEQARTVRAGLMSKIDAAKEERDLYKGQLQVAQDKLQNHSVPERAEFEFIQQKLQHAQELLKKADTRHESSQRDLDFLREQYQEASRNASRFASQIRDLQDRLATVEELASGEHVRLRQLSHDARVVNLQRENKQLKALLKDRENIIRLREDQLVDLRGAASAIMHRPDSRPIDVVSEAVAQQ